MHSKNIKKLNRLLYLLNQLDGGEVHVLREAREMDVTERTIQRDLRDIELGGFPLYKSAPGVYKFVEGFSLKKMNLTDEEGVVIALVFSEDGRLFFVGAPDVLKKQLTAEAAAAPARLTVAQANALDGSFLSVGIVMTDEIKAMATDASPEAAGFASAVDVFLFSAATSGGLVDLQLGASFITPEFAGAVKSMLDTEVVPQVKAMAPAVAGEADVSFVNSLACSQKGNVVNLTCSLSQADIFTVVQLVGKFMDGGSEEVDELDEDVEEFDEDGVEVEEVY